MNNEIQKEPELLVNDSEGIYISQTFCKMYAGYITNMNEVKNDVDTCLEGPESEHYWDAWERLINNVQCVNDNK